MIKPFDLYVRYLAFKLHFSSPTYDFFTFNGKTRAKEDTFQKRNDRFYFEKAAKNYSTEEFTLRMVAAHQLNSSFWIKDIFSEECKKKYLYLKSFFEAFEPAFRKDLSELKKYCIVENKSFLSKKKIYQFYLEGKISIITFFALDTALNIFDYLQEKMENDPLWIQTYEYLKKVRPFVVSLPQEKIVSILVDIFVENKYNRI